MKDALGELLADIDRSRLRVVRPTRFVFLCGGKIDTNPTASGAHSLRDYLYRIRNLPTKAGVAVVLAEGAQQLYRDTSYHDLISFEEDIARISAVILVISESAGSLAELGAFSSNETIREALRIIIEEKHAAEESFVRYGPVEKILKINRERVGIYPWKIHKKGGLVKASAKPHFAEICKFIREHVDQAPETELYDKLDKARVFYDILWIIYLCNAVSPAVLYSLVRKIYPTLVDDEIRNKLFCMKVAGWVSQVSYSSKDYYYCMIDVDPYEYAFAAWAKDKDSPRRKLEVRAYLKLIENLPKTVHERVLNARKDAPK